MEAAAFEAVVEAADDAFASVCSSTVVCCVECLGDARLCVVLGVDSGLVPTLASAADARGAAGSGEADDIACRRASQRRLEGDQMQARPVSEKKSGDCVDRTSPEMR